MKDEKKSYLTGLLMMALGLGLSAVSLYALPICHGDEHMSCYYMVRAEALLGGVIGSSGVLLMILGKARAAGVEMMNVLLGLAVIAIATIVIGPCPSPMMACHAMSAKVLVLWGAVVAVVAVADAWRLSQD